MKVPRRNHRLDRYQRQIRLAVDLMLLKARAQVVSAWSGLTPDQITTLRKRYLPEADERLRGQSPTSFEGFFRSTDRRREATLFVCIFLSVGLHSTKPSLEGGERLREAYEIFQSWEPDTTLQFDYALLLAMGALQKTEIELSRCPRCLGAVLIEKLNPDRSRCEHCRNKSRD